MKFSINNSVFEVVEVEELTNGPWTHAIKARKVTDKQTLDGLALVVNGFIINALIPS